MNIVATSVEPEYLHLNVEKDGAGNYLGGTLTIDIARLQVAMIEERRTGSLQVILMRSDLENIRAALH